MFKNTKERYGSMAKSLHWTMSVLILCMLFVGYFMGNWGIAAIYNLHKLTGLLILILVIVRIMWTLNNTQPALPPAMKRPEHVLSRIVQGLLYICMVFMPLSGWAMVTAFGYFPHLGSVVIPMPGIPIDQNLALFLAEVHGTIAIVLIVLISLHVLGALKHHFINKDEVLKKMWPGAK